MEGTATTAEAVSVIEDRTRISMIEVPCSTIYARPALAELIAEKDPDRAGQFVRQHPEMIESWTIMQRDVGFAFLELQSEWINRGGELYISDMWRNLDAQKRCYKEKTLDRMARGLPALAKPPAWSLHWLGCAFDFDTEHLGKGFKLDDFLRLANELGWTSREAWHLQKYATDEVRPGGTSDALYCIHTVLKEMPMTTEKIHARMAELGYAPDDVKGFQRDFGLAVDGIPGSHTQHTLALATIQFDVGDY